MVGEGVPQVTHSHTKLSSLYRKIYVKTGADQGFGGASLQATSTADLFLLQAPWTLQSNREFKKGKEKEEKSSEKSKIATELIMGCSRERTPFYRLEIRIFPKKGVNSPCQNHLLASQKISKKSLEHDEGF